MVGFRDVSDALNAGASAASQPAPDAPSPWSQMSDQQRFGLIGAALKDIGAHLDGRPDDATHLSSFHLGLKLPGPTDKQAPSNQVPSNQVQPMTLEYRTPATPLPGAGAQDAINRMPRDTSPFTIYA